MTPLTKLRKSIAIPTTIGLLLGLQAIIPSVAEAQQYNRYQHDARWPVDQTIQNLKNIASSNTYSHKEMQRYDTAMTHLSEFAEKMQRGRFDRGKLERGIGDVQNVLNKNPMDGRARDVLNNDVMSLRRLRSSYPY
jgi:hypothetical protein